MTTLQIILGLMGLTGKREDEDGLRECADLGLPTAVIYLELSLFITISQLQESAQSKRGKTGKTCHKGVGSEWERRNSWKRGTWKRFCQQEVLGTFPMPHQFLTEKTMVDKIPTIRGLLRFSIQSMILWWMRNKGCLEPKNQEWKWNCQGPVEENPRARQELLVKGLYYLLMLSWK